MATYWGRFETSAASVRPLKSLGNYIPFQTRGVIHLTLSLGEIPQSFGAVLRQIREGRSLSQEQLGFESGYHRTYISLLERGLKSPSLGTIMSLAAALGVTATEMIRRVERQLDRAR